MNRFKEVYACILIMIVLYGCGAGRFPYKPDISLPSKWSETSGNPNFTPGGSSVSASEVVAWWRTFNDPVLSLLIEQGLKTNHDIKIATAKLKQARAVKRGTASGLWPQLEASSSYKKAGSGSQSVRSEYLNTEGSTSSTFSETESFRAGFDSSWEIDLWGGKRLEVEAAEADIEAVLAEKSGVLLSVSAEIADNYFSLRSIKDQKEIALKNLEAQQAIFGITDKKYRAGLSSSLDRTSANAQVAASQARIPELEAEEKKLIYSISLLTGGGLDVGAILIEKHGLRPSPPHIPVGLPSDLLKRRPDIIKAEAQLQAASARAGAARTDYFPKITLTGSFGYSGTDADSFLNWSSRSWSFGPAVSIPLFNAGRISANIEAKTAAQEEAAQNYEKIVMTALNEAEISFSNYSRNLEKHMFLAKSAKENSEAAEMALKLYGEGLIDYSRVLEARKTLYSADDVLAASNARLASDLVSIFKALGGGWND